MDDHTHFTWYFLKSKSDVLSVFSCFCKIVNARFGQKVKSVRSVNAHEFNFSDFLFKSE